MNRTEPEPVDLGIVRGDRPVLIGMGVTQSCVADQRGTHCFGASLEQEEMIGGSALSLSVGEGHACVVRQSGPKNDDPIALDCWGENARGQLGDGTVARRSKPTLAAEVGLKLGAVDGVHPKKVVVGKDFTCVETVKGVAPNEAAVDVRCFGSMAMKPLFEGEAIKSLAAGGGHACVVKAKDGSVWCWGANDAGQLGDGGTAEAKVPVAAVGVFGAVDIACGRRHTCARHPGGTVACWGANDHHQLANGTTTPSARPVPIHGLVTARQLVAAGDASCVLLKDGDARCWGRNDLYQLGDGTTVEHVVPAPIKLRPDARTPTGASSSRSPGGGW